MLTWLTTRLRRDSVPALERAPVTNHPVAGCTVFSPRRGITLRPMEVVRIENRASNRRAREARKVNR